MSDKKILQNDQNKPFNISGVSYQKQFSKMSVNEFNSYLDVAKKYSPFFQKENLYKNIDSEKIIKDLFSTKKINFFRGYIPLSIKMNAYISIARNIVTKVKANEDEYQEISEYLLQDVLRNSMMESQLKDIEHAVNEGINKYMKSSQLNNRPLALLQPYNP